MHPLLTFNIITAKALELFDPTLPMSPEYVEPMTDTQTTLAEMGAEIERQRRRIGYLEGEIHAMHGTPERPPPGERPMRPWASGDERLHMLETETERLRARVAKLEAVNDALAAAAVVRDVDVAVTFGTLAKPTPDEPATITHNIPPSAPPHDAPVT